MDMAMMRGQHRLAQRLAQLLEQLPVLGALDATRTDVPRISTWHSFRMPFLASCMARFRPVCPPMPGHDGVGTLVADDLGDVFQRQRLHVDLVRNGGVGHDGGGVGVDEDHLVALLLEREAGLRARIVELRGLSDDDGAGADDQNLLEYLFS